MSNELAKRAAAEAAISRVQDKMIVGLGSGTTAEYFIKLLGARCCEGLSIEAVATSKASFAIGENVGISMRPIDSYTSLDLAVDGADEVTTSKTMIKGGGGALLREKIVASMSRQWIVIADKSKLVKQLGAFPLPIEIVPFGYLATIEKMKKQGFRGSLRETADNKTFVTDNGNYIYDIHLQTPCISPKEMHEQLINMVGVVETGLFFDFPTEVIIADANGELELF